MNNVNVDPWVYEFSSDVMKDIQHANARPSLSQVGKSDIKTSAYINENVNMFTRPQVEPVANIFRPKAAPKDGIPGWMMQKVKDATKEDIAANKYINNDVHMVTKPEVDVLPHNRESEKAPKAGN